MNISINKEVFKKLHPELMISLIKIENFDNQQKLKESRHLLHEMESLVRLTFNRDTPKTHHLIQPWEAAKQEFGKKARHYHTSVEKLLLKVLKGKSSAGNDVLSNLLAYISLKQIIPVSADDSAEVKGKISFNVAKGTEKARVLKKLEKGDLYYKDERSVLGAKLDYWKNSKSSLTKKSRSALVHLEALPPITSKKFKEITSETISLIKSFCGGDIKTAVLDKKNNSVNL